MNKQIQRLFVFVGMLIAALAWTTNANAFTNFEAAINSVPEALRGSSPFGIFVDATTGEVTYSADTEGATMVVSPNSWNGTQHGFVNIVATIDVEGPVKVGLGNCQYGSQTGTITDTEGNSTSLTQGNANCYAANNENSISYTIYRGTSPTTLTITYNGYCPFISVEAVDLSTLVEESTVTFSKGSAEGKAPAAVKAEVGSTLTIPANSSLYLDGSTLTGWSDGSRVYSIGDEYTFADEDVTLTPVFTQNTVAFADRESEVTAIWDFQTKNGALSQQIQGATGIVVTQIVVNGETIDFKLDIDASSGKYNNTNWVDWCQVNNGTTFTLPMYTGTVVSTFSMNDNSATTFAGGTGTYDSNVNTYTYEGSASTMNIVINGGSYYRWVKAVYPVPTGDGPVAVDVNVAFSLDGVECDGQLMATGGTYTSGDDFTLPAKNFTLYKEGYTQTGWSDGTTDYAMGATVTLPAEDVTFTPVFTQNTVSLADRTAAVTVKWNFRRDQGAPSVSYQNQTGLLWVTQAVVNGETIDVALPFSTNPGKFNNTSWTDWCQMNSGTTFTVPSCKGATISMQAYGEITTTTIDGQSDYTTGQTISYEIANTAETVDVVIGDGSYYSYIQVVLPVVQQSQGESYDNAEASVEWPMLVNDAIDLTTCTATPATAFSVASLDYTPSTMTPGTGSRSKDPDNGMKFVTFKGDNVQLHWFAKPAAGLTFTPTQIRVYVQRFGTNKKDGVVVTAKVGEEGTLSTLGTFTARRANWDDALEEAQWGEALANLVNEVVIDLTAEQQEALTSGEGLHIYATTGLANNKDGGFVDCRVYGTVNGTVADVNTYALTIAAAPEEGGTVSAYPAADEYEEGTEVTLTATENFGYNFVNWTDAEGNEVSTEAKFKYTMEADAELTANFVAVETYELALTVDGTNDYMVAVSPKPTVVDGKNMYEAGTNVVLTANQYAGLVTFNNWSDGTTNSELTVVMEADQDITATYSQADIIAGWDFYTAGNNGRKADFYAADNDADALNLVKTDDGTTSGWLDKSTIGGGGYESFAGAAVNWRQGASNGDVGNYHWQTKVNAEAFQDINVQFQMLYNYNAYQTYNVEWSIDGENWENAGSITMTGAKQVASFNETLPNDCDNQANLYIRMIADKESQVDGAASANDGNTLAMFFITGNPQLEDDGVAPVLVSTVPEEGATGASASGKIVLTFDERVKVADGAVGMLDGVELTPTVSGKTVTFAYKGLDYASSYTFELAANSVADLTDNYLTEPITLTFTTMVRPSVEKGLYDFIVPDDGTIVEAITAAAARSDKNVRFRIFIKDGEYTIPLYDTMKTCNGYEVNECITFISSNSNISFIGESRDGVVITNAIPADATFAGTYGTTSKYDGIGNSDVFQIASNTSGLYWQDLTVSTGMEDARGRDIAIQDRGTKNIYKNVKLHGYQDTWTSNNDNGLYYFEGGIIRGRTDYMCGKGDIFFNGVELWQVAGGYAAVPSKPANIGWVFKDCVINGDNGGTDSDGNYTLGRPWGQGTPVAVFIDTKMNVVPSAIGWSEMSGGWPARFAEYNSTTSTGTVIDLSGRKTTFGDGHANNPVLNADEAAAYSDMSAMYGDWEPMLYTEQAPVPTDVVLAGNTLTWTGSDYALLYAICKDGSVIGFTTEETYTVDDLTGVYTVRAANEMGGLCEASEEAVVAPASVSVTITSAGVASFSSIYPLDFTNSEVKAYIFTGRNGTKFVSQNVSATPANTGLVVKAAEGTYEIPVAVEAVEPIETNWLVATSTGEYTVTDDDYGYVYGLFQTTKGKIGFQKKKAGFTFGANKSYMRCDTSNAADEMGWIDAAELTGITGIAADGQNAQPVYNLNGQRVNSTYKGVVITNGEKRVQK